MDLLNECLVRSALDGDRALRRDGAVGLRNGDVGKLVMGSRKALGILPEGDLRRDEGEEPVN